MCVASLSVPFRPKIKQMPNFAVIETKRITVYMCCACNKYKIKTKRKR